MPEASGRDDGEGCAQVRTASAVRPPHREGFPVFRGGAGPATGVGAAVLSFSFSA